MARASQTLTSGKTDKVIDPFVVDVNASGAGGPEDWKFQVLPFRHVALSENDFDSLHHERFYSRAFGGCFAFRRRYFVSGMSTVVRTGPRLPYLWLGFGEVAGAPEVPAGYGAPRLPFFGAALHDVWFGEVHRGDLVGGFEFAEGEGEAFADAVVVDREDVGAAEAEDEEHLGGPAAYAADLSKVLDDGLVGHAADVFEVGDGAVEGFGGEVAEGEGLVF